MTSSNPPRGTTPQAIHWSDFTAFCSESFLPSFLSGIPSCHLSHDFGLPLAWRKRASISFLQHPFTRLWSRINNTSFSRPPTLSFTSQFPPVHLHLVWHQRSKVALRTLEEPPTRALPTLNSRKGLLHVFCRRHLCLYIPHTVCLFCNIKTLLTHVQIMF